VRRQIQRGDDLAEQEAMAEGVVLGAAGSDSYCAGTYAQYGRRGVARGQLARQREPG
jgi:hypothetical protein